MPDPPWHSSWVPLGLRQVYLHKPSLNRLTQTLYRELWGLAANLLLCGLCFSADNVYIFLIKQVRLVL